MLKPTFAIAALLVVGATGAQAAETAGTVQSLNKKTDAITLNDGKTYALPESVEAETLEVGEKVKLTYETSKGRNKASHLTKVP